MSKDVDEKALLDFYWDYFQMHSSQRMQMINFYIGIEVVLIGGLFALLQLDQRICWAECLVSLAISFISLIFYGLDYRTKELIHWCESCIEAIEQKYKDTRGEELLLFSLSERKTKEANKKTYSTWLTLQFVVIGILGISLFICFVTGVL